MHSSCSEVREVDHALPRRSIILLFGNFHIKWHDGLVSVRARKATIAPLSAAKMIAIPVRREVASRFVAAGQPGS
jgi:hypothetical protein